MSQKMLALVLLALPITACVVQTPDGEAPASGAAGETVGKVAQADSKTRPGVGQTCHSASGVVDGVMGGDGWCCGKKLCDDILICGFEHYGKYEDSCANCAVGADVCSPGSRLQLPTSGDGTKATGGVLVFDPGTGTSGTGTKAATTTTRR